MTKAIIELAKTISPQTIAACKKRDIAADNEAKYGGDEKGGVNDISAVYRDIAAGFDNGRCTTRQGTYRHFKRLREKRKVNL